MAAGRKFRRKWRRTGVVEALCHYLVLSPEYTIQKFWNHDRLEETHDCDQGRELRIENQDGMDQVENSELANRFSGPFNLRRRLDLAKLVPCSPSVPAGRRGLLVEQSDIQPLPKGYTRALS